MAGCCQTERCKGSPQGGRPAAALRLSSWLPLSGFCCRPSAPLALMPCIMARFAPGRLHPLITASILYPCCNARLPSQLITRPKAAFGSRWLPVVVPIESGQALCFVCCWFGSRRALQPA